MNAIRITYNAPKMKLAGMNRRGGILEIFLHDDGVIAQMNQSLGGTFNTAWTTEVQEFTKDEWAEFGKLITAEAIESGNRHRVVGFQGKWKVIGKA